ncbi:hypothetical protein TNCV_140821 [Trichonephila clavipes]|nr:hypothetical protein TNCV_140821 [Trichonephila clavipes]
MLNPHHHKNSECGPVCDLKTVAEISKNGSCYPSISIKSTKSHNPSPKPISGNKCATSERQYCQITGFAAQSPQEYEFQDKLFTGDSIMLACMPEDHQFAFPSRLGMNALV